MTTFDAMLEPYREVREARIGLVYVPPGNPSRSGEDLAFQSQRRALAESGLKIEWIGCGLNDIPIHRRRSTLLRHIANGRFDALHAHRWFPHLTLGDLAALEAPVALTLHNYMPICPVGSAFRGQGECYACSCVPSRHLVLDRCYRHSYPASLALAALSARGGWGVDNIAGLDLVISPSERALRIFSNHASTLPAHRIIPSFVTNPPSIQTDTSAKPGYWVYVGALEPFKGVPWLLDAWDSSYGELVMIGAGSLERDAHLARDRGVRHLGRRSHSETISLMRDAVGLVFSSLTPETQGLVVGEAASVGTPVLALAGSAGADFVAKWNAGVVIDSPDQLPRGVETLTRGRASFSNAGKRAHRSELTKGVWLDRMFSAYSALLQHAN